MIEETLVRALRGLAPVLDQLVVIGGTAHRLFTRHPLVRERAAANFDLLTTEDVDFAAPVELGLARHQDRSVVDALDEAGFHAVPQGVEPATYIYRLEGDNAAYLQFVAPKVGSGISRSDSSPSRMKFAGIVAERLRGVDLLLQSPWHLDMQAGERAVSIRVVHPVAFTIQKLLLLGEESRREKRGKDLLYVFDTLSIFAEELDSLAAEGDSIASTLKKRGKRTVSTALEALRSENHEAFHEAARIAQSYPRARTPDARQIHLACLHGLPRLIPMLEARS